MLEAGQYTNDQSRRSGDTIALCIAALLAEDGIDLTVPGAESAIANPATPHSRLVGIDRLKPAESLAAVPHGVRMIRLCHVLPLVADYRSLLREAFAHLAPDGRMLITVPHQFLAERKFRTPSRYGSAALRFFTPCSLLAEIEEALDPTEYRIEMLGDDDAGYDYALPIGQRPTGRTDIVAVVRKITRPPWADQMHHGDDIVVEPGVDDPIKSGAAGPTPVSVLQPNSGAIKTIVVLKLDHRGDFVMATSALRRLRTHYGEAQITMVCGSWNVEAARLSGLCDEVLALDFFAEDASDKREPDRAVVARQFAAMLQGRTFDLALDLRYYEETRELLRLVEARYRAGFDGWNMFPWLDVRLSSPSPTRDGRPMRLDCSAARFSCANEDRRGEQIVVRGWRRSNGSATAIYGPYLELGVGKYEGVLHFKQPGSRRIRIDVVHSSAAVTVFHDTISIGENGEAKFSFVLDEPANGVEIRFYRPRRTERGYAFSGMRLERSGVIVGLHQSESMQLLVELAAIRLAQGFAMTELTDDPS